MAVREGLPRCLLLVTWCPSYKVTFTKVIDSSVGNRLYGARGDTRGANNLNDTRANSKDPPIYPLWRPPPPSVAAPRAPRGILNKAPRATNLHDTGAPLVGLIIAFCAYGEQVSRTFSVGHCVIVFCCVLGLILGY
jgi:hypothetical protein